MFNDVKGLERRGQRMDLLGTNIAAVNDSITGISNVVRSDQV